jgi:hypothetical protein
MWRSASRLRSIRNGSANESVSLPSPPNKLCFDALRRLQHYRVGIIEVPALDLDSAKVALSKIFENDVRTIRGWARSIEERLVMNPVDSHEYRVGAESRT